jgi:hypothetical protein
MAQRWLRTGQASALDQRRYQSCSDDRAHPADPLARQRRVDHRPQVHHDRDGRQIAQSNQYATPRRLPSRKLPLASTSKRCSRADHAQCLISRAERPQRRIRFGEWPLWSSNPEYPLLVVAGAVLIEIVAALLAVKLLI